jgi:hypothetical protein
LHFQTFSAVRPIDRELYLQEEAMHMTLAVLAMCSAVVFGLNLRANEKPTVAYQKAEKDLNAANNALRTDVRSIDYAALEKDALAMKASFAVMLEFWEARKVEDAIKFVRDGIKGADDLEAAAKAMNYPGVMAAQNAVAGSNGLAFEGGALPGVCVGCHLAHRQRMPDGTYEVK